MINGGMDVDRELPLQVEYPGYKECKNKYEEMTWRDLRNRLNPPEVSIFESHLPPHTRP